MIRNVLIMAGSGLALFYREFSNSVDQSKNIIGPLIATIVEFGKQTTGMGVSFIEFSHLFLAIVTNEATKISCALFYDREDGKLFGRLICGEILNAFIQDYADISQLQGPNLMDFKGFHLKMHSVIYYSVRPVIAKLESQPGILHAYVLQEYEVIDSQKQEHINNIAVLANVPLLLETAGELMVEGNDLLQSITLDTSNEERLIIWKIRETTCLIIHIDTRYTEENEYSECVEEALELIEQVGILYEDFKMTLNKDK